VHLIDRCSLLSPAALPIVTAWAKRLGLADGEYEAWYNGDCQLSIIPLGAGETAPGIVGHVVPTSELGLAEEWFTTAITFFTESELSGDPSDDESFAEPRVPAINAAVLKGVLRAMIRRSRDEAELRAAIKADARFGGDPAINIDPNYRGAWLSPSSVMIMVYRASDGEIISI
jgi:hypothetical protein